MEYADSTAIPTLSVLETTFLSALLFMSKIHQSGTATNNQKEPCEVSVKSHPDVPIKENVSFARRRNKCPRDITMLGGGCADGARALPQVAWFSWGRPETSETDCPVLLKFQNL